jgi:hypothetical protein
MRVRILVGLASVLVIMLGVTLIADRRPIGERATAWAASHASTLPSTLEELAGYPREYRREILKALPAATKSDLWRTQLRKFAADRPNLTAAQRSFVQYAIDLASPASFEPGANPPELCDRIAELFPNAEDRKAFTTLTSVAEPVFAWRSTMVTLTERVRAKMVTNAKAEDCGCRGSGLCECSLLDVCVNEDCNQIEDCGCIFVGTCTRVCRFIIDGLRATKPKK